MRKIWLCGLAVLLTALLVSFQQVAQAATSNLFFSEYIEGSSNSKALEIYNGTGAPVDLAADGYKVEMYFNGNASAGLTINLSGTIADGDVFVLAHSSAGATVLAQADQTNGSGWFNGDDTVVLRKGTTLLDAIGQIGADPGSEWGSGLTSTADNTLRRKSTICTGDTNGADAFDPSTEWDGLATNTFDGLGSHTATCDGTTATLLTVAATDATAAEAGSDPGTVRISRTGDTSNALAVNYTMSGSADSADYTPTLSGQATIAAGQNFVDLTITPVDDGVDEGDETVILTLTTGSAYELGATTSATITIGDDDAVPCSAADTPISAIQGSGSSAAITGAVTVQGVVVGDYEGGSPALRGFYVQEEAADYDGDPATSEAIFIFNGNNDSISLGQVVQVSGNAGEFQDQTQISGGLTIEICDSSATVSPVDVTLPMPSADYLERYEGMLVRLPQTLYVTEHFQLGRFGQVVLSADGRLQQPTNVAAPGAPALAVQAANDLNRIILDDGLNNQNPDPIVFARGGQPLSASNTLRGGDTATGIVGVLTYTWAGNSASGNAYRVRPINALGGTFNFVAANPRPATTADVSGSLQVAGMNLLNYFNTFDGIPDSVDNCTFGVGGAPADCRGADSATEFDRQWPKTVAAIVGTQAEIIGIVEIENDGYGPDSAIAHLVNKLNEVTAPGTYAFIDVDAATGQTNALGTDAIKVGLIYKPAAVTPVGTTAVLNSVEFVNGGDSSPRNRATVAQAFAQPNGATLIVNVNHLKSKGSACDAPDAGDGQGNCNTVRVNAANTLADWLASDPTGTGDPDVLIVGDLNAYAMEDPITTLTNQGYTNLIATYNGADAYSYVFNGQWGYLDHALGSDTLAAQVTGVTEWHINADEPNVLDYNTNFKSAGQIASLYAPDVFRVSDHDPVIVGLDLNQVPVANVSYRYWRSDKVRGTSNAALYADGTFSDDEGRSGAWHTFGSDRGLLLVYPSGVNCGMLLAGKITPNLKYHGALFCQDEVHTFGFFQGEVDTLPRSQRNVDAANDLVQQGIAFQESTFLCDPRHTELRQWMEAEGAEPVACYTVNLPAVIR